jgi:methyltransferase family protein
MNLIVILNPDSLLDIGTGFGKYGLLCREYLELWDGRENYYQFLRRIDGVEAFGKYITPLHQFVYNNIYVKDVLDLVEEHDYSYDLVLLVDVLEHFDKLQGKVLLSKLLAKNKGIFISTPKNPSKQKNAFNNIYERHRSRWTRKELLSIIDSSNNNSSNNGSESYFIHDTTHLVAYIGKSASVKKLRRKLLLRNIKKIPSMSSILPLALRLAKRYGFIILFFLSYACCISDISYY